MERQSRAAPRLLAPGPLFGAGARPLAPAAPLRPDLVSVLLTPLTTLFHAFRALFYPPWFFFLVMFFWYGYKYNWDRWSKLSATDQTCIIGAFVLAFMQSFGRPGLT